MADTLYHRGPDGGGVWVVEAAGIALGHSRRSILDLSPAGHHSMASACGRYLIARAAWKSQLAGQASYGYRLWSMLMFQAWLEQQG